MATVRSALRVRNWSLSRKLVAVLIAAALLPFAVAAMIDLKMSRNALRKQAAATLAAHAEQLRAQIDALHLGYLTSAEKLAGLAAVQAVAGGTADPSGIALVRQVIEVQVESDRDLAGIAVVDREGRVMASYPALARDRLAEGSSVRGKEAISELYVDRALGGAAVAYSHEIAGLGHVVVWVSGEALWDLVRGANALASPDSFAAVFDHDSIQIADSLNGTLRYHPIAPLPDARRAALIAQQRFGADTSRLLEDVEAFPELHDHIRAAEQESPMFQGVTPINGKPSYAVSCRLNQASWTVVYLLPVEVLDDRLAELTRHKLVVAACVMVGMFAAGLWLASLLLFPVSLLSAATARIASGDLSTRVPVARYARTDELGQLCDSFNTMAERIERDAAALRRSHDELEDRVAERTGELVRAAVTQAQAREQLEASAGRLAILSDTAHELAEVSGDADRVLELAARRLGEALGDACTIRLLDDDGGFLQPTRVLHHRDPDPAVRARVLAALGVSRVPLGAGLAGRVAQTGEAMRIAQLPGAALSGETPRELYPVLVDAGVSSLLAVPLRSRTRTTGVVTLLRTRGSRGFTIDDQRFAQDVADRAGLALDNAVLVENLERRVATRTAALETANRELEAFSYSVSHDLRSPLRTIDGFGEILLSDHAAQLDPQGRHYLQRIRAASQRMAGLIDDLLDLARITRVELRWQPIDVSAIAGGIAAELARSCADRTTLVHIAPGLVAHGDARLITIVLENLLGNAWKFTGKDPAAEVWLDATRDGEGRAVFRVRDTGAGFDMKYAEKLFLPFQRLHTADEFEGVGVGLATVHRIIARHGGRIWAEATVGGGATFYFYLGEPS
ncbi:MAG TPA: ATP-binding protein [Kofleriaceae bacterium]